MLGILKAGAAFVPFEYAAPRFAAVLLLIVPAALLVANGLAAWPARRAARMRIADTLRTE